MKNLVHAFVFFNVSVKMIIIFNSKKLAMNAPRNSDEGT